MNSGFREQALAWGFLAPALTGLVAFGLFPIVYAFYVSLHQWRIRQEAFVGWEHYLRALGQFGYLGYFLCGLLLVWGAFRLRRALEGWKMGPAFLPPISWMLLLAAGLWLSLGMGLCGMVESGDARLYNGLRVTLFYTLGTIPAELCISLGLAYLLFKSLQLKGLFRVLYFLPYVTPTIATAVVFRTIFSPHPSSWANRFWGWLGFEEQRWLYESTSVVALLLQALGVSEYPPWIESYFPSLALVSVILYNIWVYIGYDTVILLAGLSAIPRHYYEVALMDGASTWQSFRHITLPLLSPVIFFLSIVGVIGTFKAFNHVYIMRTAGARDTVDVLSVVVFDLIFEYHNAGYAAAIAILLFMAILALTLIQNRLVGRRVFYGD